MTRASNTRDQIIDIGFKLMLQRGINGFSYRDISKPLGVKNAAIHYHFPNKRDLVKALIHENHQVLRKSTAEFMAYGGPARPQLEGMFAFVQHQVDCGRPICMAGVLAVGYDELDEDIQKASDRFAEDSLIWLTKVLETGRKQGEFDFTGEAKWRAAMILATVQGARQFAHIHGTQYLGRIFEQLRADLGLAV